MGGNSPVTVVVPDFTAVQSAETVVFICRDLILVAVDGEGAVLDAVGIPANHGTKIVGVVAVLGSVVEAHDNILRHPVAVRNKQ